MNSRWLLALAFVANSACLSRAPIETIRATACVESEAEIVRDYLSGEVSKAEARSRVELVRRLCDRLHDRFVKATGGEE